MGGRKERGGIVVGLALMLALGAIGFFGGGYLLQKMAPQLPELTARIGAACAGGLVGLILGKFIDIRL